MCFGTKRGKKPFLAKKMKKEVLFSSAGCGDQERVKGILKKNVFGKFIYEPYNLYLELYLGQESCLAITKNQKSKKVRFKREVS